MEGDLVVQRKPHHIRIDLMLSGEAASWVNLPLYRMRLGAAELSMGGFANVGTKPEHRNKGLSRHVLEHALKLMTDDGLDVTMLFGIGNFYEKFDYAEALSEYEITLPGRAVVDFKTALNPRTLDKSEHALVLPLHRRFAATRALTLERVAGRWNGFFLGSTWTLRSVATGFYRGKKLVGYVATDDVPNTVRVIEAAFDSAKTLDEILAWLGQECRRKVVETIQFDLPPDHPLSRRLMTLDAAFTRRTNRTGNGMMRILNLGSTMAALMPELSACWARSRFGAAGLDLTLQTDLGPAEIVFPGRTREAERISGRAVVPQRTLMQLIMGYRSVADVAADRGVRLPARLREPLAALFPERHPHVLKADRF